MSIRLIAQGAVIACPVCNLHLVTVTQDIVFGDRLVVGLFRSFPGIEPYKFSERAACRSCGALWFKDGKLHTTEGWKP